MAEDRATRRADLLLQSIEATVTAQESQADIERALAAQAQLPEVISLKLATNTETLVEFARAPRQGVKDRALPAVASRVPCVYQRAHRLATCQKIIGFAHGGLPAQATLGLEFDARDTVARIHQIIASQAITSVLLVTVLCLVGLAVTHFRMILPLHRLSRSIANDTLAHVADSEVSHEFSDLARLLATTRTAREHAEQRLRMALERFDLATQGAAVVIWDTDINTGTMFLSPQFAAICELPIYAIPTTVEGFEALIHPDDRAPMRGIMLQHIKKGAVLEAEYRIVRPSGEVRWVRSRGQAERNADGRALRVAGSLLDFTSERGARENLHNLNRQFESIAMHLPGIIFQFTKTPEGEAYLTTQSPELERLFGIAVRDRPIPLAEIGARVFLADIPSFEQSIAAVIANRKPWHHEFRVLHPDGNVYWLEGRSRPQELADGSLVFSGVVLDITARKDAENALVEQQARHELVVRGGDLGTWELDLETKIATVNERWRSLHHFYDNPIRLEDILQTIHPDDRDWVARKFADHLAGNSKFFAAEYRVRGIDDEWVWIADHGQVVAHDTTGSARIVAGTNSDITERKRALQRLRDAQALLRTVIDLLPQKVFWKNKQGRYLGSNKAFAEEHGFKSVTGLTLHDLGYPPDESFRYEESDRAAIEQGTSSYDNVVKISTTDERTKWVSYTKVPLRNAADEIIGVLGTYLDVSQFKETEFALIAARDASERANRAKDEFLSTMSHEIRTPLNGVIGCAQVLRDLVTDKDQRELADTVVHSARSLLTLLNEILDLSKIEANNLRLERLLFDPHDICAEVIELMASRASEKGLELALVWTAGEAIVESDPTRLRQVLSNLVANAIKFTAQGYVVLAVKAYTDATLHFSVTDTGIGIAPEQHARIFDKFTQADGTVTRKFGGTGLGLAISKCLVEALGGEIGVQSAEAAGATFWFTVPRGTELAVDEKRPDSGRQPTARLWVGAPNDRALTADLEALGIKVETYPGADALLGALGTDSTDTIIFDYPGADGAGVDFARAVQADYPDSRLIALCSREAFKTIDRSRFAAILKKPLARRAHVLDALRQAVLEDPHPSPLPPGGRGGSKKPLPPGEVGAERRVRGGASTSTA